MAEDFDTDLAQARDNGRREGLALAALAVSLVAYVNLLGAEKALLAIVLAAMAMGGSRLPSVRQHSRLAIGFAALQLVTLIVLLVLLRDKFAQLIDLLQNLA